MEKEVKKPESMSSIIKKAERKAKSNAFVEEYEDELYFNYFEFTRFCEDLARETNAEDGGAYIIRDIVMEKIDTKFNRNQPFNFRNFSCLD